MYKSKFHESFNYYWNLSPKRKYKTKTAKELGISRNTINNYLSGKSIPNADVLLKLAHYLNTTPNHLLGLYDYQKADIINLGLHDNTIKKLQQFCNNSISLEGVCKTNHPIGDVNYNITIENAFAFFIDLLIKHLNHEDMKSLLSHFYISNSDNEHYRNEDTLLLYELFHNNTSIKSTTLSVLNKAINNALKSKEFAQFLTSKVNQRSEQIALAFEKESESFNSFAESIDYDNSFSDSSEWYESVSDEEIKDGLLKEKKYFENSILKKYEDFYKKKKK